MGIVVTVFMGLGLFLLWPTGAARLERWPSGRGIQKIIVYGLLLAGLWNGLWHGLRHLDDFWGLAALFSGIFMAATAALLLGPTGTTQAPPTSSRWYKAATHIAGTGLLVFFLLYAVTLIRLNLDLPIIGP